MLRSYETRQTLMYYIKKKNTSFNLKHSHANSSCDKDQKVYSILC